MIFVAMYPPVQLTTNMAGKWKMDHFKKMHIYYLSKKEVDLPCSAMLVLFLEAITGIVDDTKLPG